MIKRFLYKAFENSLKIQHDFELFIVIYIISIKTKDYLKIFKGNHLKDFAVFQFSKEFPFLKCLKYLIVQININNMGNQNKSQASITLFQNLKALPTPLSYSQCVLHKHEILICGGWDKRDCYSYHTIKNKYKFICEFPSDIILEGHCVVKLINNNKDSDEITLLSFGGFYDHTLVMKYVSVWSNNNDNEMNKPKNYNQWVPFTDSHNRTIRIGRDNDNYNGVRAVIGGSNNNLLFITYLNCNISVFDLNTFQFIKHDTLPIGNYINYHCFNKNNEMLLFFRSTGLLIEYDENNNNFQFHQLRVGKDIESLCQYGYVCTNGGILFFGGYTYMNSKTVCKYLIQEKSWITFETSLPIPLYGCFGILSEDNTHIHIIGGISERSAVSTHMKTKVNIWKDISNLVIFLFDLLNFLCNYVQFYEISTVKK
ncbi:hypothetical protein RFI_04297 [Reticulomyxa filosa]|uniref:Kelch motif family protein n=1 Tax=Reticulomyxa filosa TaxID=46433 RepID=X6P5E0_RETFI|nr:hypothetical protein RFI_04297 [Reticulomyxa filosa]|eukprot:ETO32817.1 hypothetical protein RFI_04297 [Reticulomyxa filosa]